MISGTSTITVTFNPSHTVGTTAGHYDNSTIQINSDTPVSIAGNVTASGQEVTITVPGSVTINNNDNISVVLDGSTAPVTNPSSNGDYDLQVRTSVEITDVTSNTYPISDVGSITSVTAAVSQTEVNAVSQYTIEFQVAALLASQSGTVTVSFPFNTQIPSSISVGNAQIGSATTLGGITTGDAFAVSTNPSTRTITVTTDAQIDANHFVRIVFTGIAGIENASISGNYTVDVSTSSQPLPATSGTYTLIDATTFIAINSVTINPNTISSPAEFNISFTTGTRGRLVSGTSSIFLLFESDAQFTLGAPTTSKVLVNSTAAAAVSLYPRSGTVYDTLEVTVPASVTIGNSSSVSVIIDATSGFQTPSIATSKNYRAYTSVETTSIGTDYSLPVELTTFDVSAYNGRVNLFWVTESELENAYWMIERMNITEEIYESLQQASAPFITLENEYELIERIDGQGSTFERTEYQFTDEYVKSGEYYIYRIADVSYNGVVNYNWPKAVEVTSPGEFRLAQNYPNPFNPSTSINYDLPQAGEVKLVIYNVLGQKVHTLVETNQEAGVYQVNWDGFNAAGNQIASGIYFYRLDYNSPDNGQQSNVRKMLLMR
jgi:hypothetical protein